MSAQAHATEMNLPDNLRSRLATSFWSALQFSQGLTDFIVHEGKPVYVKSAQGLVPLSSLGLPGANFAVTAADIKNFVATYLDGIRASETANGHWEANIEPALMRMEPVNRSLPVPMSEQGDRRANLRASLLQHSKGRLGMVIRLVVPPPPLQSINLPDPILQRLETNPRGLLIITGPTASGKTSTALSMLEYLNDNASGHIVTIEDPIELELESRGCIITQRQVGTDVPSFGAGLVDAMRHAPDAILAGEVRDRDAAEAAVMGGESGSLMIVTTHGRSIVGTLRKVLALCGDNVSTAMRTVMAGSLIGVIRQELMPHTDGRGYSMAHETLTATDTISNLLSRGDWPALEAMCAKDTSSDGFFPMRATISQLVQARKISPDAAERVLRSRAR